MAKSAKSTKPLQSSPKSKISTGTPKDKPQTTQEGLHDLFVDGIKDMYWAERHLVKSLPKMIRSASSKELANTISNHLEVTRKQAARLEKVFAMLGEKVMAKKCDAMEGLTKEGECVIESTDPGTAARDTGIIMASRKVEHYEMAAYTGLSELATDLGLNDIAKLLDTSLAEEAQSDKLLAGVKKNNKTK